MRTEFIADSAKVKWDEVEIEPVRVSNRPALPGLFYAR